MKLACRKSDWLSDWYVIEKAKHENISQFVPIGPNAARLFNSARMSDADVEGPLAEMQDIARAILDKGNAYHKRCACQVNGEYVEFWSPRNSQRNGIVPYADAVTLAHEILAIVPEMTEE